MHPCITSRLFITVYRIFYGASVVDAFVGGKDLFHKNIEGIIEIMKREINGGNNVNSDSIWQSVFSLVS